MKPWQIGLLLFILCGAVGVGGYFLLRTPNVPKDGHYSLLDYRAIDAKGLSRLAVETTLDGCTAVFDAGERAIGEKQCACILNTSVSMMSKEEFESLIVTMGMKRAMVAKVQQQFDKATASCGS